MNNTQNSQQAQDLAKQARKKELLAKLEAKSLATIEKEHRAKVKNTLEEFRKSIAKVAVAEAIDEVQTEAEIQKIEQAVNNKIEVVSNTEQEQQAILENDCKHKAFIQQKVPPSGFIVIIFALISMVMPMSIDMYLSSFGIIAQELANGDFSKIEFSLSIFFIGIAGGQFLWGPISDSWGRKKISVFALACVAISCLIIANVQDLQIFYAMRFVQGFMLACVLVTSTAMLRDIYETQDFVRINGLITLLFFIAPFVAPLIGSWVSPIWGWHSLFYIIGAQALLGFVLLLFFIPETINPSFKRKLSFISSLKTMGQVIADGRSLALICLLSSTSAIIFLFVSISSSVYTSYGITPSMFPYFFMINIVGQTFYNILNTRLVKKLGPHKLLTFGIFSILVGMCMCIITIVFDLGLIGIILSVLICNSSCTLIFLNSIAIFLEIQYRVAGTAGSLLNICRWVTPGVVTAFVQELDQWHGYTMISFIGIFALLSAVFYVVYKLAAKKIMRES